MSGPVDVTTQVLEQSTLELPTIELGVVAGPDRGLRRKLDPTGLRIGTSPAAQLRLQDATVSRMHCEIRIVDGRVRIIDLGSTNGVLLDGVRVYDAELAPGSNIQLGSTKLQVDPGDGSIAIELSPRHSFGEVLGASIEMRRLFTVLEKAAASDATILIQGETGVGKELVARAIHESSKRSHGPFVVVDSAAEGAAVCSKKPTAARSSSTKSASSPPRSSRACCA